MYYVYVLTNVTNRVLYVGVTNNLSRRLCEHRTELDRGSFTARYRLHKLVFFEALETAEAAISREKQWKSWSRARKEKQIAAQNPQWRDLSIEIDP